MQIIEGFLRGDYMPHGHCYLWHPGILWTNVISDLLIAFAYFSIPVALLIFTRRRPDIEFKGIFILFAAFILFCGITHLFSIYTIWHGSYGVHGIIKALTAAVSVVTAVVLYKNLGSILKIPTVAQLETALTSAANERVKRSELEIQKRADSIFKFTTELIPTGLLVIDPNQKIKLTNNALASMFGYQPDELIDQPLNVLMSKEISPKHNSLVDNFVSNPEQKHRMASGRIVRGKAKNGEEIAIAISLSVHDFEGEQHTFASISNIEGVYQNQTDEFEISARLRRAIDATKIGIWEWNVQTDKVWYSNRLLELIGQPSDVFPEVQMWFDHIHPDDQSKVKKALEHHFADQSTYDVEYRGKNIDGEYEWLRTRGDTLFDNENRPLLMSGTLTNINNRHLLEKMLADKTRFLNEVLERSLTGLYIFNLESMSNTFINPEYTKITGYTLQELIKIQQESDLMTLFHPEDLPAIHQHLNEVIEGTKKEGVGIEYRFKHKDGHWVWCYSRDSIYSFKENGKAKEMLGAFFDITELKKRELEVKRLAQDFYTTFEQAAVGIAHVDLHGKFIKVNQKLAEILGYSTEELVKFSFKDITYADDIESSAGYQEKLINGEIDNISIEKRYVKKDGQVIWANLTVTLVEDTSRAGSHFISVIEDISQKKKIELNLADSNAALERFAYSASHDLQEPLRKISAFAGSLKATLADKLTDPDAKFQLERIVDAAKRMGNMISQLLELSRYSRSTPKKVSIMFSEILATVTDDLSPLIEKENANISLKADFEIWVEPTSFQQVLRNVIGNSINYKKIDGPPEISIEHIGGNRNCHFKITDNGIGFDPSNSERIFEPFRRLVGKERAGTGMGLAICKQIINAHEGSISASSKPDIGTTFEISLPLMKVK